MTVVGVVLVVAVVVTEMLLVIAELIVVIEAEVEEDDSRAASCLEFSFIFDLSEACSCILIFCCSNCYEFKEKHNVSSLMTNSIFVFFSSVIDTIPVVPIHAYVFSCVSDN